ncbi:MAG: sigma factor-binding protein Crl [Moritella sp.]|jgi:sigma factor-binding protein Crl
MPTSTDTNYVFFRKRIRILNALGPYLRENESKPEVFMFDCLTICVDAGVEPAKREFYGWWLKMDLVGDVCEYHYQFGLFNEQGHWQKKAVPKQYRDDVVKSLNKFYEVLSPCLQDKLALQLKPSAILAKALILSAA